MQGAALFDRHAFGKVSRLVDLAPEGLCGVVGEQLHRQHRQARGQVFVRVRHRQHFVGVHLGREGRGRDQDGERASGLDLVDV